MGLGILLVWFFLPVMAAIALIVLAVSSLCRRVNRLASAAPAPLPATPYTPLNDREMRTMLTVANLHQAIQKAFPGLPYRIPNHVLSRCQTLTYCPVWVKNERRVFYRQGMEFSLEEAPVKEEPKTERMSASDWFDEMREQILAVNDAAWENEEEYFDLPASFLPKDIPLNEVVAELTDNGFMATELEDNIRCVVLPNTFQV